jgi:peptide methionine sulfoxide reductase MsrA
MTASHRDHLDDISTAGGSSLLSSLLSSIGAAAAAAEATTTTATSSSSSTLPTPRSACFGRRSFAATAAAVMTAAVVTSMSTTSSSTTTTSTATHTIRVPFPYTFHSTSAVANAMEEDTAVVSSSTVGATETVEDVYFGVGCFWHIQHEFVNAERTILNRNDDTITSRTGYAGGTKTDGQGRVCYHNLRGIADYGSLGHGEVVGMTIPTNSIVRFANVYYSLFNQQKLIRVDPNDRGGEYRSLIGLQGGTSHPLYADIVAAAIKAGFTLQPGKGNDPDTISTPGLVYVYDSTKFPFHQAEIYHQFHDDFQSPPYGNAYHQLADKLLQDNRLVTTGCPDRV